MAGSLKKWVLGTSLLCLTPSALAGAADGQDAIKWGLLQIREAAIAGNPDLAAPIFAKDLTLVSQSGKLYGQDAALLDLRNRFSAWDNSDIVVREKENLAIVTLVNRRTRAGLDPAEFLVLQVWHKVRDRWMITAQSSVAVKKKIQ